MTEQLSLTREQLVGRWHIILTNLPMWIDGVKSGEKTRPTLNYGLETKSKVDGLSDCVEYLNSKAKPEQILGFNTPLDTNNTKFQWRGKGWLWLITSNWDLVYVSPDQSWAISHFESTLFTPEGYDVIHREAVLSNAIHEEMRAKLVELGISNLSCISAPSQESLAENQSTTTQNLPPTTAQE